MGTFTISAHLSIVILLLSHITVVADKIKLFEEANKNDDVAAMLPLISEKIKVQTPKGIINGRDEFFKHIKDGIK